MRALALFSLLLALGLLARAFEGGISSPFLGIAIPGKIPDSIPDRLELESAFRRVASLARFTCDPTALEVYRLERRLGEEERRELESQLLRAGWRLSSTAIGGTRLWSLERELFGRRTRVLLVEAQEGNRPFLGACPSLI